MQGEMENDFRDLHLACFCMEFCVMLLADALASMDDNTSI